MSGWTAIIPLNHGGDCKTRLAPILDRDRRGALAIDMARHVVATLARVDGIGDVRVLSPQRPPIDCAWTRDTGAGLNAGLAAAAAGLDRVLFLHADLPLVAVGEIEALLNAGTAAGVAIAPDERREGTNALAGRGLVPSFGGGSFARHLAAHPNAAVVERPGLALDIDEPASLGQAMARGYALPW